MKRAADGFYNQSGEFLSCEDLRYHISSILSGVYSLGGHEDWAVFEELIHPDPVFSAVSYLGVPDVRIIVYHGVSVMGMVRLPTRASDGKANLHRGAVHRSRVITHHPDTGHPVQGIQVPCWEEMLLMAAAGISILI